MAIESFPIYGMLRSLFRWLPAWLLRRHYTRERLASLIYLDFLPRCESARVNLAEAASIELSFQVINGSPFPVELDRAWFRFSFNGASIKLSFLERKAIASGETALLYLYEALPDGHATQIAKNSGGNQAWLEGNLDFNCNARQFSKNIGSLSGIQLTIVNGQFRTKSRLSAGSETGSDSQ